ncbi:MAG TPA: SMC-Scp complex subunit ScpB [Acidobacteriaceae bacterium]|jgi:segregation and condensation protein B|nr:SMC-Scp complex subunit ScpB [Acidobacteriaceae bacterium]
MSLKARIEAVIYAAEEPVTLAQLTPLFREEALLNRAGRETSEPAAQNSADAEVATPDVTGEPQPVPEPPGAAANAMAADLLAEAPTAESTPEPEAQSTEGEVSDPDAEKKAARARDREARDEIRRLIGELIEDYAYEDHGLEIREVAGGFRFATRPEVHDAVRGFIKSLKPPMKLSLQALETLAVIAYKQPVTAPEIGEIRGVDSGGVLGSLIARKLVTTAGRKQVVGRPILYKTTKEFLLRFGLKDLNELPSIEEFEKMASELTETEEEAAAAEENLPFAQNEIAAIEENAESGPEASSDEAPTSEQDAALEEHQP